MSFPFNPRQGLILVETELEDPSANAVLRLALDTGAMMTLVSSSILTALGYDPTQATQHVPMTTGSGIVTVPCLPLMRVRALGLERTNFPVCHTLPPTAGVDGLLGLDFLRGRSLKVDFIQGIVSIA